MKLTSWVWVGASAAILAACAPGDAGSPAAAVDPLLAPIAPEYARQWLGEEAPVRLHGDTFLVGFAGLNVALIRTDEGLILVDGAVPQAVPSIERNLRALGFRLQDVRYILSTEPHYDHAGGLAALSRGSGATVLASPQASEVLARGRSGPDDPQADSLEPFPPVRRLRSVADGESVRLGDVVVTARATPGHTPGSTSWTWRSCEAADCRQVVFASSLSPISADGYRFSDPANRPLREAFVRTFEVLRQMPCDILITSPPSQSTGAERPARLRDARDPNPFIDRHACRAYADRYARLFEERLQRERSVSPGGR